METTQKNREAARKRPQQAAQKQPAGTRQPGRTRTDTKQTPAAQQRPAQKRPAQPRQRSAEPQQEVRRSRPVSQEGYGKPSAPQGTGPRKSAPQRSAQERSTAATKPKPQQQTRQKRNSLQNLISSGRREYATEERVRQADQRRKKRAAEAARKRRRAQRYDTPAVIYTAPKVFNRNRFLVQLLTVVAVVIALIMGLSVFFKVKTITVSGAEKYSVWTVREASGIDEGDNLLTFSIPRACGQIMAELSYVDKVRIGIKLPDTVNIYIEELDVAYAIKDSTGTWWLMTSDGRMVEQVNSAIASAHTQVLGVTVESPVENEMAVATENIPTETDPSGELVPVTITGAQRLHAALQILKALEANDIVGEAASVEVSRLEDVILWYGTRYQVNLGDTDKMEYKIACMNDTILQLSDYQTGVLDISFTTFGDQVGYTPFQ